MATLETRSPEAGAGERQSGTVLFDAVLTPNRSLSPRMARRVLLAVGLIVLGLGLACLSLGWWPIAGYFGVDVLLLWWAFRASSRSGRLVERLRLTGDALTVARIHPNGSAVEWTVPPTWLRVEMDDPPDDTSQLILASHGRQITVGGFLTPAERLEVANALRAALRSVGQPSVA
ncbi:MAG: DUF2244 domain-containing protein [Alphaproteobacteria bacterium]